MNKKPKIQRTNRIRLKHATIYCSCEIVRKVKDHVMRCNQILVPLKDHYDDLIKDLRTLAVLHPDHFPTSSKLIIGA